MKKIVYALAIYRGATKLDELVNFDWLTYQCGVNAAGLMKLQVKSTHRLVGYLEQNDFVDITRITEDGRYSFRTIYEEPDYNGIFPGVFTATCRGMNSWLDRAWVMWPSGEANRSQFNGVAAETIMKTLARYNATGDATMANGRICNGPNPGITIATDQGRGNVLDWYCAQANLLATMQKLALAGGGDFDIDADGEFEFYPGQLGSDRRATIKFAVNLGTMAKPRFYMTRIGERNVVVIGGEGAGDERLFRTRYASNYSAANHREAFINGAYLKTEDGLDARGDAELEKTRGREFFTFEAQQTRGMRYQRDYDLGDLVTVVNPYSGVSAVHQFMTATVEFRPGQGEKIVVGTEERDV